MKSIEIIVEELKKEGVILAEESAHKLEQAFANKIIPRLALEAEEPAVKLIASGIVMILPAVEPAIEKAIDFNHDGKIGE